MINAENISLGAEASTPKSIDYNSYSSLLQNNNPGPQLLGYQETDYEHVIIDTDTRFVQFQINNEQINWPLLSPIEHNTEYVNDYFRSHYDSSQIVYYLSLPPRALIDENPDLSREIASALLETSSERAIVVLDEIAEDNTVSYLENAVKEIEPSTSLLVDKFIDSRNDSSAAAIHYQGVAIVGERPGVQIVNHEPNDLNSFRLEYKKLIETGELDIDASTKTVLLEPRDMDKLLNTPAMQTHLARLWQIYNSRFGRLIENYPVRGAQTYSELETMAKDPNTFVLTQFVDNDIVAFAMFVGDMNSCDWLNADYYKEKYPNEALLYFPCIASDESKQGSQYSLDLIKLLTKIITPPTEYVRIVFQCTNISSEYIPRIVRLGINASKIAEMGKTPQELCRYNYLGISVTKPE
jgi:hypothetical protein